MSKKFKSEEEPTNLEDALELIRELKTEIESLEDENEEIRSENEGWEDNVQELEKTKDDYEMQISELQDQLDLMPKAETLADQMRLEELLENFNKSIIT